MRGGECLFLGESTPSGTNHGCSNVGFKGVLQSPFHCWLCDAVTIYLVGCLSGLPGLHFVPESCMSAVILPIWNSG